jgi:hypothetical protein
LPNLAKAQAELGQLDPAWCSVGEALAVTATSKEKWREADV